MVTHGSYQVCGECAPVIMYGDDAGDPQDSDFERIHEFIESHGLLVATGETYPDGYWACDSCSQVCIGSGIRFTRV